MKSHDCGILNKKLFEKASGQPWTTERDDLVVYVTFRGDFYLKDKSMSSARCQYSHLSKYNEITN